MKYIILLACVVSCTLSARIGRIVGGEDSAVGAWPWQGGMEFNGDHHCGAVLIGNRRVLTAAHCIIGSGSNFKVVLGMHDRTTRIQGNPTTYNIVSAVRHPDFAEDGPDGLPNDIALFVLDRDANIGSEFIDIIEMAEPADGDFSDASDCYITGWGRTSGGAPLPNILQQAKINVITNEACRNAYAPAVIFDGHVCVTDTGKGACNGDSGGPLVCRKSPSDDYLLVGLTSWGPIGCSTLKPSVYTRVPYFKSWVDSIP